MPFREEPGYDFGGGNQSDNGVKLLLFTRQEGQWGVSQI